MQSFADEEDPTFGIFGMRGHADEATACRGPLISLDCSRHDQI